MTTTTRRALNPAGLPTSPFYSQGVEVGADRLVFVSGQVGVEASGAVVGGVAEQATRAVGNLHAVLAEAGMQPEDIVKMTVYLTDVEHVPAFVAAAAGALPAQPPATTMLVVAGLASPDLLVEIEAVAAR